MMDLTQLRADDLRALSPDAVTQLATQMLAQLAAKDRQLQQHEELAQRYEREIKFKDAKLERVTFELARLKAWKFGARTERMNAEQRQMFEETAAEDEADLQAQLLALQGGEAASPAGAEKAPRQPRRQKMPEHLRRIEHRHEPADIACGCGKPMGRQIQPIDATSVEHLSWRPEVQSLPRALVQCSRDRIQAGLRVA